MKPMVGKNAIAGLAGEFYRRVAQFLVCAVLITGALLSGGCAMTASALIDPHAEEACDSTAGSYYLSKTMFEVLVTANEEAEKVKHKETPLAAVHKLISVQAHVVADRSRGYCLDFVASPTAKEAIHVASSNGLLDKITTDSSDRSAQILKNVAKTIMLASSAGPLGAGGMFRSESVDRVPRLGQIFKATYDPLNPAQTNLINQTLRQHGFCLVIEEQTFKAHRLEDYCDHPLGGESRERALDRSAGYDSEAARVVQGRGLFYRPRVAYNYYLFVRQSHGWVLRKSVTVNIENKAPVLAVGIDRAFFADRKTAIVFDQGVLKDVAVEKSSELAGFVEVPLAVAQGVTALPANIVKVKIDIDNQRSTLIAAQDQLLAAQSAYNADVAKLRLMQTSAVTPIAPPTTTGAVTPAVPLPTDITDQSGVLSPNRSETPTQGGTGGTGGVSRSAAGGAQAANPSCQPMCVNRGFPAQSCQTYCSCVANCSADESKGQTANQRQSACASFCVGTLP